MNPPLPNNGVRHGGDNLSPPFAVFFTMHVYIAIFVSFLYASGVGDLHKMSLTPRPVIMHNLNLRKWALVPGMDPTSPLKTVCSNTIL